MYLSENLQKKWEPVLNHPDLPEIKDPYRRAVTALVLENQQIAMQKESQLQHGTFLTTSSSSSTQKRSRVHSRHRGHLSLREVGFDQFEQ